MEWPAHQFLAVPFSPVIRTCIGGCATRAMRWRASRMETISEQIPASFQASDRLRSDRFSRNNRVRSQARWAAAG